MKRKSLLFLMLLAVLLIFIFGMHILILHYTNNALFGNQIIASYSINYSLAVVIFCLSKKHLIKILLKLVLFLWQVVLLNF